jgi:hypothetical protein
LNQSELKSLDKELGNVARMQKQEVGGR